MSPGDKTCFKISIQQPPAWQTYEFERPRYTISSHPAPQLTLMNLNGGVTQPNNRYRILAQIRNDHTARVNSVKAIGTLYNSTGTPVGCSYDYVGGYYLDPGETGAIEIVYTDRDYSDVTEYHLQADGDPQ